MAPASASLDRSIPTKLEGVVDAGAYYSLLTEAYEYVPDVMFPTSVLTYGQMRRDAQITAVLQAYTLPIRRATWVLDPTGCSDKVVQLVADDMGLPILGNDQPGAARTRGMSWAEHLRTSLMHLVYGFYGFELLADTSSGQARLVNAYERVPQTVTFIHSTHTGDFGGISQIGLGGSDELAEILPDRMVWYCHDREGSAWHGNSILRSSFAPWLLKREMMRVHATSNRRFGMGVPTVRALPGTSPTPEQMAAASSLAGALRVGETAGASIPPNFVAELLGITGSTPDTLSFLKYLDGQISRTTLAGFLDLADTKFGSRALGSSFIDLFTLSITAVAEYIADVATRQIAARIVGWNYGDTEPVPAVKVTDIGTKHEITAEAIQQLMAAGAIGPDPALEEHMRQMFQLPQRSIPWVPPVKAHGSGSTTAADTGGGDAGGIDTSAVAAAKRPARSRKKPIADGQMALPIAAAADDPPSLDPAHQDVWKQALADLQAQWPDLSRPMVDDLSQQAADDVDAGDLAALGALAVSPTVVTAVATAIATAMTGLAATAAGHVVAEAKAQGKTIAAPADLGIDKATQVAHAIAGILANGYSSAAARKALQVAASSATADEVQAAVAQVLTDMGTADAGWVADNLGAALSAGQNTGRFAVLAANPPKKLVATERHDASTCDPCSKVDGVEFQTLAEAEAAYPMSGFVDCLGGLRCRGTVLGSW